MLIVAIALILLGAFLILVELVLFPGISIAGICALGAYSGAIYLAFEYYGSTIAYILIGIAVISAVLSVMLAFRAKLWSRFSLKSSIEGQSQQTLTQKDIEIGSEAVCLTRLAPMGTIEVDGKQFEARSEDSYLDPKQKVIITGVENFTVLVRKLN